MLSPLASLSFSLAWWLDMKNIRDPHEIIGNTICYWLRLEQVDPDLTNELRAQFSSGIPPEIAKVGQISARVISQVCRTIDSSMEEQNEAIERLQDTAGAS